MKQSNIPEQINADWEVPDEVRVISTTRNGGVSRAPWNSLNLGAHVGDDPDAVQRNRDLVQQQFGLPSSPVWLNQVHSNVVVDADQDAVGNDADASVTGEAGKVCVVMTADCLPVTFCNTDTTAIGVAHAGWRGLAAGILQSTAARLGPGEIVAWMGPAIGPDAFEVGVEVLDAFVAQDEENRSAFRQTADDKWLADIYHLARNTLARAGVARVSGGGFCTFSDAQRFYSYRRDGQTGRMATLIWKDR